MQSEGLKRLVVITGGPIFEEAADLISPDDIVYCADGGVDFALENGIRFKEVYGDLDSITPGAKAYIDSSGIPVHLFPVEKDMTDTELTLRSIDPSLEVLVLCPLQGRIDHVLGNLDLAAVLREEGRKLMLSDGKTDVIPLSGSDYIKINDIDTSTVKAVSLIPVSDTVTGVTTDGLYYELNDGTLKIGSTFSNSNELKKGADSFSVEIKSGRLLVIITDKV